MSRQTSTGYLVARLTRHEVVGRARRLNFFRVLAYLASSESAYTCPIGLFVGVRVR